MLEDIPSIHFGRSRLLQFSVNFEYAYAKTSSLLEDAGLEVFGDLIINGGHDVTDFGCRFRAAKVVRWVYLGTVGTEIILERLLEPICRKLVEKNFKVSCAVGDVEILG